MKFRSMLLVALVAGWLGWASAAQAGGYRTAYYNNPYTGGSASRSAGYNSFTGNAYHGGQAYNPYTGTHAGSASVYNPYTGKSGNVQAAYNPYTNKYAYHYNYTNP